VFAFIDESRRERLRRAVTADAELRRVAAGAGALALALGETLREIFEADLLGKLCFTREKDYMRERLGLPPRTGYQMLRLAKETRGKDLLRRAVLCGAITPNKALAIARVCSPEMESAWVGLAMEVPLAELVKRVKDFGGEPVPDETPGGRMFVPMTAEERAIYEEAVALAQELLGPGTPRWVARETIAWEWLGEHGSVLLAEAEEAEKPGEPPPALSPRDLALWTKAREDVERELRVLEEASKLVIEGPDPFCKEPEALDARARRLARTRERLSEPLGAMLRAFRDARYWKDLGYDDFEEYARDRLGLSARTVRERIWLTRMLETRPEVRAALRIGKISYAKALALVKVLAPRDPEAPEKVESAAAQPTEKVQREAEAEEERQDRALGRLRIWGPAQAMESIRESIESARAVLSDPGGSGNGGEAGAVSEGRALATTGACFIEVWKDEKKRRRPRPRARRAVLARKDGLCGVPGCTMRAVHAHHIVFRSHQGSDAVTNLLATCWYHHVLIHARLIRVWGLAGERLVFEFLSATDRKKVVERWETRGNDDTRRVGPEAEARPGGRSAESGPAGAAAKDVLAGRSGAPTEGVPAEGVPAGRPPAAEGVACARSPEAMVGRHRRGGIRHPGV
jgi:hypothetical protein